VSALMFEPSRSLLKVILFRLQVAQIVESYIMGGIHRTVYPWVQQQYAQKDQKLSQVSTTVETPFERPRWKLQ
jgi:hypothetical protein